MKALDPGAFYRVWEGLGQSPARHGRFHRDLFAAGEDSDRVSRLIIEAVKRSEAEEADKVAVLHLLTEDWRTARNLAAMASSCSADPRYDEIQSAVIARVRELGLTAYAVAKATGGAVSEDHVRAYLSRQKSMGSHKLQHIFRALGLTVQVNSVPP
jgi:hypothetical protein